MSAEGRSLEGWSVAVRGLALAAVASGLGSRFFQASALLGLFLVGLGAQLALTDPLWLQSIRIDSVVTGEGMAPAFGAAILLQAVLVGTLSWGRRTEILGLRPRTPGAARVVTVIMLVVGSAAHASLYVPQGEFIRYARELGACAVHCWCVALSPCAAETCIKNGASESECGVSASFTAGCVPSPTVNGASTPPRD